MTTAFTSLQPGLPGGEELDTLRRVIRELDNLPLETEKSFLQVGAKLRDISHRLVVIAEQSSAAAAFMSEGEIISIIDGLRKSLDRMELQMATANEKAELAVALFGRIREGLVGVCRLMADFQERVATLRMMKTLTNIQSAGLGVTAWGFRDVAADIGNLSQNIRTKSAGVIITARELGADLERALSMVSGLEVKQKNLSRVVVETIRHGISSLSVMNEQCAGAAEGMSNSSGAMSREIGEVVMAMQFQDITRQQMEHARQALADAAASLGKGCRKETAIAADDARPASLADLGSVCELQAAQLTHTADELVSAIGRITANLRNTSSNAVDASARAHQLLGLAAGIGRSSMGEIEGGLASVSAVFTENVATNRELTRVMASVTEAMGAIATFLEDIDYIGSEIKLIALNAIIKAAQAGSGGAALNVIAQTVKGQSEDICRQAAVITEAILGIAGYLNELRGEYQDGAAGEREAEVEAIGADLERYVNALRTLNDKVLAVLGETDRETGKLSADIEEAIAGLQMEEGAVLKREVIPRLNMLALSIRAAWPAGREPARGRVNDGEQRYTMRSERDVHESFVSSADRTAGIWRNHLPERVLRRGEESGFGDNVEFF